MLEAAAAGGRLIAREAIEAATAALDAAGCAAPKLDAELLIADALGVTRERLFWTPTWRSRRRPRG